MSPPNGTLVVKRDEIVSVEWQIDDVLSVAGHTCGLMNSPTFRFSKSSWYIRVTCYDAFSDEWIIRLYLRRTKSSSTIMVTYDFYIEKGDISLHLAENRMYKFHGNEECGYKNILDIPEVAQMKNDLFLSGALTIKCILKEPSPQEMTTMCEGLSDILASKKFSDVTIRVGQQVFEAHKIILAASSSKFAAMFEDEMLEKNSGTVNIEDCDPELFKLFLKFLYAGRTDIAECNVLHLYRTAHKYCVEELKSHCIVFMVQNLSFDNIFDVVALAHQYSEVRLNSPCRRFFLENIRTFS